MSTREGITNRIDAPRTEGETDDLSWTRTEWLLLAAMSGAVAMVLLDQTVVTVALPSLSHDLSLAASAQQWVVNVGFMTLAACVAVGGRLGDRFGQAAVFRIGIAVFFLASLACGLVPAGPTGPVLLITARAVQGIGAALMLPVSAAIVANTFSSRTRGRAMAVYTGYSQVFVALGPIIGGALTQAVSWRAVFLLNVPLGLAVLLLVHIARPADTPRPGTPIRTGSVLLLMIGVTATLLGIERTTRAGLLSPTTLLLLGAGLASAAAFSVAQLRARDPLLDLRLCTRQGFTGNVTIIALFQFGLLAVTYFGSLYTQNLLGFTPLQAGLGAMPFVLPIALAAQIGGRWYDRRGVRPPVLTGLAVAAVGLVAWAVALPQLDYPLLVPIMLVTGVGFGLAAAPTYTDALGRVDPEERGQAAGLAQVARQLGGTIGVAVIGAAVLAAGGGPDQNTTAPSATATAVGFALAAGVFLLALILGAALLPRDRVTTATTA